MQVRADQPAPARGDGDAAPVPDRLRFPPRMRLRRERDFRTIYRSGSRVRGATLILVVRPSECDHARLGLSVGKRCWKRAVRRNRVRRIFREAFRLEAPGFVPPLDVVMIPAVPALVPELAATRRELVELYARACRKLAARASGEGDRGTRP